MTTRTITTANGAYMIRGNWSVKELQAQYAAFVEKFKSQMTFDRWLVERGKVYVKIST